MYLIDTNIFIEIFLNQKEAENCEKLLQRASQGEIKGIVTSFTVHAVEGILSDSPRIIEIFLRNLSSSFGISVYATKIEEELEISIFAEKIGLDFDDSVQYFAAKKLNAKAIISFDRHFDSTDLRRAEPREILDAL